MDTPHLFTLSSVDKCLGCFHFLAFMNHAAVNICIHVSVWTYVVNFLGYIPMELFVGYLVSVCLTF